MTLPEDVSQQSPLLESAVEQTTEAVLITEASLEDPGPRIIYVNPAFTDITGYKSEEVVGETPRLLQGPETEPWVLERLRKRLRQGLTFEGEAINYRKDGSPYVNRWSIAPVHNDDGTITHWVSVQRDVTARRRMNERLLQAQETERQQFAQQMHDKLDGLLSSMQKEIEQSHMQAAETDLPNDLFDALEEKLNALSDAVRTFARKESTRHLEEHGLNEALSRLVDSIEEQENLEIAFHNEIENQDRLSSLLAHVVYRVLRESLSSIAHHAPPDTVQVILNKTNRKLRLHITDQDTEAGASKQQSPKNNLGLDTIRERVEQLNGSFMVDADPENGTRVTVSLPLSIVTLTEPTHLAESTE